MTTMAATLTLTRFRESDGLVLRALSAAACQTGVVLEILFYDQSPSESLRAQAESLARDGLEVRVIQTPAAGLSAARNRAIGEAAHDIVLYLDADARPEPDWARRMIEAFADPRVAVAGSRILPEWTARPPRVAGSSIVLEQYSMLDMGSGQRSVPKVVGAGFGLHRGRLGHDAFFSAALGRRGGNLMGGEETDLCARAISAGHVVLYQGDAVILHLVEPERLTYRWLVRRFFYAGRSRAARSGAPAPFIRPGAGDVVLCLPLLPAYAAGLALGRISGALKG